MTRSTVLSCFVLLALLAPARASFFRNSTGISNPAGTVSFDEHVLANDSPIADLYADAGIASTSNLFFHNFSGSVNGNPNVWGNFAWNRNSMGSYVSPFSITFVAPQSAAAFAISGQSTAALFEALLDGVVVDSGTADISHGEEDVNDIYGFTDITFDQIRVTAPASGLFIADVDNIQLSVVPEPATLSLLVLGAFGLRRRNR